MIDALIYLEVELENALEEISAIQLELEKEFGGTGLHLEVELEKVFQLLWSLLYTGILKIIKLKIHVAMVTWCMYK